ncbi:MAG: twin-arginine translocation signal domain-containing protein [Pseudomonadota bacterium]|nr:twin-arginine translocation signal domain-containing protein [Pseudomonadota bacterium]
MPTSRRTFLQGAAVGAAALVPTEALAGPDRGSSRIHDQLRALRSHEAVVRQEYLDSVYDDRPAAADRVVTPHIHALASGLAALSTIKDIEQMPLEDQAHPGVQRLIRDAAAAVGLATFRCRELLEHFLTDDSPERETHLRAGLRGVRMSVRDWPTTTSRQRVLDSTLAEVEQATERGALLRRVRRGLSRIQKAERVAAELEARGEGTAAFEIRDPVLLRQVAVGRARWAAEPIEDDGGADELELPEGQGGGLSRGAAIALGIVVLAIGCAVGGILAIVGLCVALCGSTSGVLLLLAGMAIIGLSIWGGITLIQQGRRTPRRVAQDETADDTGAAGRRIATADVHLPVLGADGWVDTGVERAAAATLFVRGTGLVRFQTRWVADADGNGETAGVDAFVPAAPLGALVGRVGDDVFFLGSEGVVPEGAPGRLQLAVNQRPGAAHTPKGHFAAHVTCFAPGHAG